MTDNLEFWRQAGRILNSGQTRSLLLCGAIHDLFFCEERDDYTPLIELLAAKWTLDGVIPVVYELNGPIRFVREADRDKLREAWLRWRTGMDSNELAIKKMLEQQRMKAELDALSQSFDANLQKAIGMPTVALETLRQMCMCSRTVINGEPMLRENLLILIEGADMIIPEGEISRLSEADRHRVSICHDWFSDPGFMNAQDSVVMIAESRSQLNQRVARLPQLLQADIPAPDADARRRFIEWFYRAHDAEGRLKFWSTQDDLVRYTAGLSLHALMQLLKGAAYQDRPLELDDVIAKVEDFIQAQLGDDIVEFKKPTHSLDDLIGFGKLKQFLREEMIPRFKSAGPDALPGAAVGGPIGGGKTYIFEAVAGELDMVVLVLKNIRSQWYGQTDVIFERLRRVLQALDKVVIFLDEADTQLGGVGADAHSTERRLTGKVQAMMSDPQLRGRVIWLLMTARIHLLSPDIRRPGRVGDLIVPVLDPEGEDRREFIIWAVEKALGRAPQPEEISRLSEALPNASSASFASLRSELLAKAKGGALEFEGALKVVEDHLPPAISDTRRYQTLQALVNCTRRSLLPEPEIDESARQRWAEEIRHLEEQGVR
ncbi:ATP-binding protein [Candidatus Sumerlaeota bacterium]|nr:ATP-binding protein [Candidatus Sumerlaeota bacterium]